MEFWGDPRNGPRSPRNSWLELARAWLEPQPESLGLELALQTQLLRFSYLSELSLPSTLGIVTWNEYY